MSGSYFLRNIDCLLNLQGNAHPSGKNTLILAAMYHPGNFVPMCMIRGKCACFRAKTVEISGHLPAQPHLLAARQADFEAVATLFGELHQYNASLDARFTLAENWRQLLEEHFRRTCSLSSVLWLLAWVDGKPVGLLMLENHLDSPLFRHHAWVELVALYVRASSRGTGLARRLMDEARLWAAAREAERMQLYVTTSNEHARAFYRRCGWKPVQEIWRLELPAQGPATPPGDDPSCGTEAERRRDASPYDAQIRVVSPK